MTSISINSKVGYKGNNNVGKDIASINDLLNRVPDSGFKFDGTESRIRLGAGYGPSTDKMIYLFQLKHFPKHECDACVWPRGGTLAKLNALAAPGAAPAPISGPAPGAGRQPAKIAAILSNQESGHAYIKGLDLRLTPHRSLGRFRVPLYTLTLGEADASGKALKPGGKSHHFKVIRFGVSYNSAHYAANKPFRECFKTVGPESGEFQMKRHQSASLGETWRLKGPYLIHTGPRNPLHAASDGKLNELAGAVGCLEVTGAGQWGLFNELVRALSFPGIYQPGGKGGLNAEAADKAITEAGSLTCVIEKLVDPPLKPLTDFTMIGGPRPVRS